MYTWLRIKSEDAGGKEGSASVAPGGATVAPQRDVLADDMFATQGRAAAWRSRQGRPN